MKFFKDLRFCYRPTVVAADSAEEGEATSATNAEAPLLSSSGHNIKRDAKHSRLGSGSTPHWRPTLSAISEDGVVSFADGATKAVQSEKKASRKGKSMAKIRTLYSLLIDKKYNYDRDNTAVQMVMPAFSPTPFTL